jgi:glycerate dehydrogenase
MQIVILDSRPLNPGDLSWEPLLKLGPCRIHEFTDVNEVALRGADADVILTNKVPLSASTLAELPRLRYIGVLATGYDVVDVAAARHRGVVVTNVPTYGTTSVAQHVFALLLELTNQVGLHSGSVLSGEWLRSGTWCYWNRPLVELRGLKLGLLGYGRIAHAVAGIAGAFGMVPIVHSRSASADAHNVSREELFCESDILSLHCPVTTETVGVINEKTLSWMKPSSLLINTSRGRLVVERDLAAALNENRIAGAGLDVLSLEPPNAESPLLSAKNCVITPHVAWATQAARRRLLHTAAANLAAFLQGVPINQVLVA